MESGDVRARTIQGLGNVLGPIIRVLLRTGVTWRDFSELGKALFVKIATEEFGLRGRPTNAARVAILSGLDRREVARVRRVHDQDQAAALSPNFMSKPTQVLEGWYHDPDFRDETGAPRELNVEGERSFSELVRRYAPGLPMIAMIKELRGAGAIEERANGKLRALKRAYIPAEFSENQMRLWASDLEALGTTIEHNLRRRERDRARFHRRAINLRIAPDSVSAFEQFLELEGQAFLERIDDWLSAHEATAGDGVRLGVSVFHIQNRGT
jgi:hypothetical protein